MFDHHATHVIRPATHVILALAYMCQNALMRGATEEAVKIARLSDELELLFPDAEAELIKRFSFSAVPDREG